MAQVGCRAVRLRRTLTPQQLLPWRLMAPQAAQQQRITVPMATERVLKIFDKPRFGVIVGLFALTIVAMLLLGWLFMHFDPLHMRSGSNKPRTGMMLLQQGAPSFR